GGGGGTSGAQPAPRSATRRTSEDGRVMARTLARTAGLLMARTGLAGRGAAGGVAGVRSAALEAAAQPRHALLRRPVGEALRVDRATGSPLERVVADRGGRGETLLEIAGLEEATARGMVAPHAGEAVGLELLPHRRRVASL